MIEQEDEGERQSMNWLFKGLNLLKYLFLIGALIFAGFAIINSDSTTYIQYLPYIQLMLSLFLLVEAVTTFKENKFNSAFFLVISLFCLGMYMEVA